MNNILNLTVITSRTLAAGTPDVFHDSKRCQFGNQSYSCGSGFNMNRNGLTYQEFLSRTGGNMTAEIAWRLWSIDVHQPQTRIMKIVLMTMDEWPLLSWWTYYHGEIFGFENLYIMDSSTDMRCVDFLKMVQSSFKVNVIFTNSNLNNLAAEIHQVMQSLISSSHLMMKMDTDEFLTVLSNSSACRRDESWLSKPGIILDEKCMLTPYGVKAYIDSVEFPFDGSALKVGFLAGSSPTKENCEDSGASDDLRSMFYGTTQTTTFKSFFDSRTYKRVSLGSHTGKVMQPFQKSERRTDLGILHFRSRCLKTEVANSRKVCVRHGYISEVDDDNTTISKLSTLIQPVTIPKIETNCKEKFGRKCKIKSCHKAFQVLQNLICPETMEERYYTKIEHHYPNHHMENFSNYLIKKYELTW